MSLERRLRPETLTADTLIPEVFFGLDQDGYCSFWQRTSQICALIALTFGVYFKGKLQHSCTGRVVLHSWGACVENKCSLDDFKLGVNREICDGLSQLSKKNHLYFVTRFSLRPLEGRRGVKIFFLLNCAVLVLLVV